MVYVYIYTHTHIYTMEYYSARTKNAMPFVATWMGIEIIILSEVNETEKTRYHMISLKVSKDAVCPTLCDPMDFSLPGSSVHGICQARVLEWVAISSRRNGSAESCGMMDVGRVF